MRVLLTGADGYIGSVAGPLLLERGFAVVGLDAGYYSQTCLYDDGAAASPPCMRADVREVTAGDLAGFDAVVHLAELSNDPLSLLDPELTYRINHRGSVELAKRCREAGVRRFVYASSCSVYGTGHGEVKTEESEPVPLTPYARCKLLVERDVGALADRSFTPTFLRNATAFGPSPRMRFDLVLNNLAGGAWVDGEIRMTSDGSPWRPMAHVRDIAGAIAAVLEAPAEAVHAEVFNVGDSAQNYRVREIAEIVASAFPGCRLTVGRNDGDVRSYRVSFDKLHEAVPAFRCGRDAERGAEELRDVFRRVGLSREMFESRAFTRLKQIRHLLETGQVDDGLRWKTA